MEKISSIVRGNPRVTTSDNKSASTARPGMPSFGRSPGESTAVSEKSSSTASRAVALHNGMVEAKKAVSQERIITQMADQFFMSHGRRPGEEPATVAVPVEMELAPSTDDLAIGDGKADEATPLPMPEPKSYTPRGSFVNVRA